MKITKTNYDMSGFKYDVANFVYTGKEQGPTFVANLPKDLKVDYTIQQYVNGTYTEETSGYKAINAGEYKVTAKFKNNNPNYNNVKDVEIKFQINKNEILIDDVFLEDKEYVYDGDYKNLVLTFAPGAKSLPREVSWGLYYNDEIIEEGMKDVGEYDIEARFTTSNPNYIVSSVIKGKLTITPAIISMASIVFESESFVYSPTESRCILCNADSKNFEKEKYGCQIEREPCPGIGDDPKETVRPGGMKSVEKKENVGVCLWKRHRYSKSG